MIHPVRDVRRGRRAVAQLRTTIVALTLAGVAGVAVAGETAKPPARAAAPTSNQAPKPAPVEELKTRTDLRGPFNLGRGKVRVVTFLAPSCVHCIANATALQKTLSELPDEEIEVLAVWLKILDLDSRAAAVKATTFLHDARVQHYWDPKRVLNYQLLDAVMFDVQVRFYDVLLLYGRDATWTERLPRPGFWMHEFKGAPGPIFDPAVFAAQIRKALRREPLGTSD